MATTSSAGGGSAMSNAGQGTRGLSAGDWTRIQRLKGARTSGYTYTGVNSTLKFPGDLTTNLDISPSEAVEQPYGKALLIPYEGAGTHRTLRPASKWTDHIASQHVDFVTNGQANVNGPAITQSLTRIGDPVPGVAVFGVPAKNVLPGVNAFNRLKILS